MPKEIRKRGKKHKKTIPHEPALQEQDPSWIVPRQIETSLTDRDAPFGYVNDDVKSYFRSVDAQIREWQQDQDGVDQDSETAARNEGVCIQTLERTCSLMPC
jgi:nucleolar protein 9